MQMPPKMSPRPPKAMGGGTDPADAATFTKKDITNKVTRNCIVNAVVKNKQLIKAREERFGKAKKRKTRKEILAAMELQELIVERSAMARMGFLDKAEELDMMIEAERARLKKERDQQDQAVLDQKMNGLRMSHTRRTAALETEQARRIASLREKCAQDIEELKTKQKKEYDTLGQRLRASGRLREADEVDNMAAAIEARAENHWRKTVEESILSSAWCGGKSRLEQMVARQQTTLRALLVTHTERMARLKQQNNLQRRNLQSTLAAERKKVILYCRREAIKRRTKDIAEGAKEARKMNKHQSNGMQNVSKNMFKDSDDSDCELDSDDDRLEGWKPPTASGVDNSKALSSYEDIASGNVHKKLADGTFGAEEDSGGGLKTSGSRAMDAYRMRQTGATATFDPTRGGAQVKMGKFAAQPPPGSPPVAPASGPAARTKGVPKQEVSDDESEDDDGGASDEEDEDDDEEAENEPESDNDDSKPALAVTGMPLAKVPRGPPAGVIGSSPAPFGDALSAPGLRASLQRGPRGNSGPPRGPLAGPFPAVGFSASPAVYDASPTRSIPGPHFVSSTSSGAPGAAPGFCPVGSGLFALPRGPLLSAAGPVGLVPSTEAVSSGTTGGSVTGRTSPQGSQLPSPFPIGGSAAVPCAKPSGSARGAPPGPAGPVPGRLPITQLGGWSGTSPGPSFSLGTAAPPRGASPSPFHVGDLSSFMPSGGTAIAPGFTRGQVPSPFPGATAGASPGGPLPWSSSSPAGTPRAPVPCMNPSTVAGVVVALPSSTSAGNPSPGMDTRTCESAPNAPLPDITAAKNNGNLAQRRISVHASGDSLRADGAKHVDEDRGDDRDGNNKEERRDEEREGEEMVEEEENGEGEGEGEEDDDENNDEDSDEDDDEEDNETGGEGGKVDGHETDDADDDQDNNSRDTSGGSGGGGGGGAPAGSTGEENSGAGDDRSENSEGCRTGGDDDDSKEREGSRDSRKEGSDESGGVSTSGVVRDASNDVSRTNVNTSYGQVIKLGPKDDFEGHGEDNENNEKESEADGQARLGSERGLFGGCEMKLQKPQGRLSDNIVGHATPEDHPPKARGLDGNSFEPCQGQTEGNVMHPRWDEEEHICAEQASVEVGIGSAGDECFQQEGGSTSNEGSKNFEDYCEAREEQSSGHERSLETHVRDGGTDRKVVGNDLDTGPLAANDGSNAVMNCIEKEAVQNRRSRERRMDEDHQTVNEATRAVASSVGASAAESCSRYAPDSVSGSNKPEAAMAYVDEGYGDGHSSRTILRERGEGCGYTSVDPGDRAVDEKWQAHVQMRKAQETTNERLVDGIAVSPLDVERGAETSFFTPARDKRAEDNIASATGKNGISPSQTVGDREDCAPGLRRSDVGRTKEEMGPRSYLHVHGDAEPVHGAGANEGSNDSEQGNPAHTSYAQGGKAATRPCNGTSTSVSSCILQKHSVKCRGPQPKCSYDGDEALAREHAGWSESEGDSRETGCKAPTRKEWDPRVSTTHHDFPIEDAREIPRVNTVPTESPALDERTVGIKSQEARPSRVKINCSPQNTPVEECPSGELLPANIGNGDVDPSHARGPPDLRGIVSKAAAPDGGGALQEANAVTALSVIPGPKEQRNPGDVIHASAVIGARDDRQRQDLVACASAVQTDGSRPTGGVASPVLGLRFISIASEAMVGVVAGTATSREIPQTDDEVVGDQDNFEYVARVVVAEGALRATQARCMRETSDEAHGGNVEDLAHVRQNDGEGEGAEVLAAHESTKTVAPRSSEESERPIVAAVASAGDDSPRYRQRIDHVGSEPHGAESRLCTCTSAAALKRLTSCTEDTLRTPGHMMEDVDAALRDESESEDRNRPEGQDRAQVCLTIVSEGPFLVRDAARSKEGTATASGQSLVASKVVERRSTPLNSSVKGAGVASNASSSSVKFDDHAARPSVAAVGTAHEHEAQEVSRGAGNERSQLHCTNAEGQKDLSAGGEGPTIQPRAVDHAEVQAMKALGITVFCTRKAPKMAQLGPTSPSLDAGARRGDSTEGALELDPNVICRRRRQVTSAMDEDVNEYGASGIAAEKTVASDHDVSAYDCAHATATRTEVAEDGVRHFSKNERACQTQWTHDAGTQTIDLHTTSQRRRSRDVAATCPRTSDEDENGRQQQQGNQTSPRLICADPTTDSLSVSQSLPLWAVGGRLESPTTSAAYAASMRKDASRAREQTACVRVST